MGDSGRVHQIILNLVAKSEFTHEGFVKIRLDDSDDDAGVKIIVSDSGPGES